MGKVKNKISRILLGMPVAAIVGSSLLPLQIRARQGLILFTLIWFNVFILFDVLGK